MHRHNLGWWAAALVLAVFGGCASGPDNGAARGGGNSLGDGATREAESALRAGDAESARRILSGIGSRTAEQEVVLGEACLRLGDRERATSAFFAARGRGPGSSEVEYRALIGLAEVALSKGDESAAILRFSEAQRVAPGMFERDRAVIGEARARLAAGSLAEARALRAQVARTDVPGVWELDQALRAHPTAQGKPPVRPLGSALPRADLAPPAGGVTRGGGALSVRPKGRGLTPPTGIYDRSAWGAKPLRKSGNPDPMGRPEFLTVHHTADKNGLPGTSLADNLERVRAYQSAHQNDEHWADIGYHFVIDQTGRIFEGRELVYQGAHAGTPEANVHNIGVALIGNFERHQPTAGQKSSLLGLAKWLCAEYGIPASRVYGHDEKMKQANAKKGTDCPGRHLEAFLPELKRAVGGAAAAPRRGRK